MRNESTYILSYNDIQYDEFIYIWVSVDTKMLVEPTKYSM
jgi:hypothetical protein